VLFVVARSLEQGRTAGIVSVLGVHAGSLVHVAAAVAGISALVASSATAFAVVKYAGAAYLVLLGIQRLRRRGDEMLAAAPPAPRARLFRQGLVVSVLNPKTAVFFLAFLPQFVDPGVGPAAPQVAVLGLCFVALGIVSDGAWALLAGAAGQRLRRSASVRRRLDRASGVTYLGLGAVAALGGDRPKA
jgi:threonine/homoserine/homoserine lactone efflux protein